MLQQVHSRVSTQAAARGAQSERLRQCQRDRTMYKGRHVHSVRQHDTCSTDALHSISPAHQPDSRQRAAVGFQQHAVHHLTAATPAAHDPSPTHIHRRKGKKPSKGSDQPNPRSQVLKHKRKEDCKRGSARQPTLPGTVYTHTATDRKNCQRIRQEGLTHIYSRRSFTTPPARHKRQPHRCCEYTPTRVCSSIKGRQWRSCAASTSVGL